jgi:hypothetical protein
VVDRKREKEMTEEGMERVKERNREKECGDASKR